MEGAIKKTKVMSQTRFVVIMYLVELFYTSLHLGSCCKLPEKCQNSNMHSKSFLVSVG